MSTLYGFSATESKKANALFNAFVLQWFIAEEGMMVKDMKVHPWWVATLKQQVIKILQMIKAGKLSSL